MIKSFIELFQSASAVAEKNAQILFQTAANVASNNFKLFSENLNCFYKTYEENMPSASINKK